MKNSNVIRQIGIYTGLWFVVTIIATSIVIAGVGAGGLIPLGLQRYTPTMINYRIFPEVGFFMIVIGIVCWIVGTNFAFIWSIQKYSETNWDAEILKNDIMYVIEDRLSEMHQDLIEMGSKKE
jgi:hypothetical protein